MKIPALRVRQWLKEWDEIKFDPKRNRSKPEPFFYLFSVAAKDLRALCGIYPRNALKRNRADKDLGIQRRHDKERSYEIGEFVRFGHPWATLSATKRKSDENADLKKPGWLPTAIVVNILTPGSERNGQLIKPSDLIKIEESKGSTAIVFPDAFSGSEWRPGSIAPIEVIDGQHRLWAFDDIKFSGDYQLPVVAFHGLGLSWQAYLFYTINIKPKRINASLAFDLYPMLRTEAWLEKFEGALVYRETRAQDLVDLLNSTPESPWYERINMLGESGSSSDKVSQAAWIRSLLATLIKSWDGRSIGGLFGAPVGSHDQVLPWSREEQAAFLISVGKNFKEAVTRSNSSWAKALRSSKQTELSSAGNDPAFIGKQTLISQDQGIRGLLSVINDLCFLAADELKLMKWGGKSIGRNEDERVLIKESVASLKQTEIGDFLHEISELLAGFDWRASSAPGLTEAQRLMKGAFRGSGGYRDLRRQLLIHLSAGRGKISSLAKEAFQKLGYD